MFVTSFSPKNVAIRKTKNIRFVRMTCSMLMGNFVETGLKLKKLKHVGALACIFVRRGISDVFSQYYSFIPLKNKKSLLP